MSETKRSTRRYKPEDLLTRHETAEYLGISLSRLAQHRRDPNVPIDHQKNPVTRAVRFRFADVERLRQWREEQVSA